MLDEMVGAGLVTATAAAIGSARQIERAGVAGRTRCEGGRKVRLSDCFDLASLSKPFAATLALSLDHQGLLPLATRLGGLWGAEVAARFGGRTLESLLRHRAGMRSWTPLYRRSRDPGATVRYLLSEDAFEDRKERYSDLDYILWGLSLERALGRSYDALLRQMVLKPLGLTGVVREPGDRSSMAESSLSNEREIALAALQGIRIATLPRVSPGVAQDGNARFLGAHAAHAGLFGSAQHLFALASEWLAPAKVLSRAGVDRALRGGRAFALGWTRPRVRGSAGALMDRSAFGHLGFTGGSLWVDPAAGKILVLLAHRVSSDVDLAPWRRRFHRLALE
jgi:CubicO group peptidase (beta-lactamase class C family)